MQLPAKVIKLTFELGGVDVQLSGKAEERKVIDWHRRLHFATGAAEVHFAHRAA
jgi:hypothetical protein